MDDEATIDGRVVELARHVVERAMEASAQPVDAVASGRGADAKDDIVRRVARELASLVGTTGGDGPEGATTVAVPPVLVVEDSPTAAAVISHALHKSGLRNPVLVEETLAGATARLTGGHRPALVILDYELPDGHGVDLLRAPRSKAALADVPVIMLSMHEGAAEIDEAHRLGVTAYLVKPVAFEAVENLVRTLPRPWLLMSEAGGAA